MIYICCSFRFARTRPINEFRILPVGNVIGHVGVVEFCELASYDLLEDF